MKNLLIVILASAGMAIPLNLFLIPHEVLMGGFTGIAMIIGLKTGIDTGLLIFVLNIPIFIMGMLKIGKRFVVYSIISVFVTSLVMQYVPVEKVSSDIIISSVFGGAIYGFFLGLVIRFGASTGGVDIIGLILTKKRDFSLGILIFIMNGFVVVASGLTLGWEMTMYTILIIFVAGKVLDTIHTKHIKLTLMIVSSKGELIKEHLLQSNMRGITVIDGEGAYSKENKKVLFTVITRYELGIVKEMIKGVDNKAFVNITESVGIVGTFRKD